MNNNQIEQYTISHWPAVEVVHYDGWSINFSKGYTKRANCINIVNQGSLSIEEKVAYCESLYKGKNMPTIFKLASFQAIDMLDSKLADRGYSKIDESLVLTLQLNHVNLLPSSPLYVERSAYPTEDWLNFYFESKNYSSEHKEAFLTILDKISCDVCYFMIKDEESVIACCLGVLENNCVSVYCLETAPIHRNKGLATKLLLDLFNWAIQKGATSSYILVVANNTDALSLYTKLGFTQQYSYWYRYKDEY